jgi:hypothetical protein
MPLITTSTEVELAEAAPGMIPTVPAGSTEAISSMRAMAMIFTETPRSGDASLI